MDAPIPKTKLEEGGCPPLPPNYSQAHPITTTWTAHRILILAALSATAVGTTLSLAITATHLSTYTNPHLQRQLVRILLLPAVHMACAALSTYFYGLGPYLGAVPDLYESIALVALFHYAIALVTPSEEHRLSFFCALRDSKQGLQVWEGGSLAWLSTRWILVYQILPCRFLATIATWLTATAACPTSKLSIMITTAVDLLGALSTLICLAGLHGTHKRLRFSLAGSGFAAQLAVLSTAVVILALQRLVLGALVNYRVVRPGPHLSYLDWQVGIPHFATVCGMCLFSLALFPVFYSWTPYVANKTGRTRFEIEARPGHETGRAVERVQWGPVSPRWPFVRALAHVLNISDLARRAFYPLQIRHYAGQAAVKTADRCSLGEPLEEMRVSSLTEQVVGRGIPLKPSLP